MNKLTLYGVNKHYGDKHDLIDFDYEFTDGVYGLLHIEMLVSQLIYCRYSLG